MGKKNKNAKKKVNPKKEKYLKFRKDKPGTLDVSMPELTVDEQKQKQHDEEVINKYLRFNRAPPTLSLKEKRAKKR